jgi:ribonuclease Z
MARTRLIPVLGLVLVVAVAAATYSLGRSDERAGKQRALVSLAEAQQAASNVPRDYYYPGTEALAPDEMRVLALGTGMPSARKSQAASCWLVQLGNGENFMFDLGTGSQHNFSVLAIPYSDIDKIFLSHLHSDHFGDLDAFLMGGWVAGRRTPIEIWGPSGTAPELGTKYAVDNLLEVLTWDIASRSGRVSGLYQPTVHEFDYREENQVIYDHNGVVVRSWPAIHAIDGPVSFSLEWNGLKFVFSGDSGPNSWFIEYAQNADLLVHETFFTVDQLQEKLGFPRAQAIEVGTRVHTSPQAAGKLFSLTKPRMAVGYHVWIDWETAPGIIGMIRSVYDGPLSMAKDLMVWNVTRDEILVRKAAYDEDSWTATEPGDPLPAPGQLTDLSPWLKEAKITWPGIDEFEQ